MERKPDPIARALATMPINDPLREAAEVELLRLWEAQRTRTPDLIGELVAAAKRVLEACDRARMHPKPGAGVCGMTIEAQTRASCYSGVDAWPIEELREAWEAVHALAKAKEIHRG